MHQLNPFRILDDVNERWVAADRAVTDVQWKHTRLLAFALLLVGPHLPRLGAVADVPEALLNTRFRWPAGFLAAAPTPLLVGLGLLTVLCAGVAASGFRPRLFGVTAALLLIVGNSILFSVESRITHHQWAAYVVLVMSLTLWSRKSLIFGSWSPRFVLSWLIAWGLLTSAMVKVWGDWLNPDFSAVRSQVDLQTAAQGRFASVGHALRDALGDSRLWELADYGTVALEVGLIFLVLRPEWFRAGILLLIGFHVGILLVLGISFVGVLPAYIPFFAEQMSKRGMAERTTAAIAGVLTALALFAVAVSIPDVSVWLVGHLSVPAVVLNLAMLFVIPALVLRRFVQSLVGRSVRRSAKLQTPTAPATSAAPLPELPPQRMRHEGMALRESSIQEH